MITPLFFYNFILPAVFTGGDRAVFPERQDSGNTAAT